VTRTEKTDLFWALRGGGGSLGVVVSMEIQLYPVSQVYAGNLLYPVERAREVFTRYREWIDSAPDELTSSFLILNVPPIEMAPEYLRGKSFAVVRGCYCGPVEQGKDLLEFWRNWEAPAYDEFQEMPFSQAGSISKDPEDPLPGLATGAWLETLDDEVIDTLIRYSVPDGGPSPIVFTEIRHAGGAVNRVSTDSSAYSLRDASLLMQIIALAPMPGMYERALTHIEQMKNELAPHLTGGVYMNFLEREESQNRVEDGFSPEAFSKLREIKRRHDPENLFRYGLNITPDSG
jgi:FAD/FMN-containing dehydrogenase